MSKRLTPEEQEQKIIENMNLVYYMIKQLPHMNPNDYDDWVQIGRIGLIKAASTFDETKGRKFSTYASRCIRNEIYMHFRKERPHNSDVSLNDIIYTDEKGSDLELGKTLGSEDDFIEKIIDGEIITNVLGIILNVLQPKEAIVLLYRVSGICTQRDVGKSLGLSQSYVSRIKEKAERKIRECLEKEEKLYCPIFSMAKVGNYYRFSCNTKYSSKCMDNFLRSEKAKILIDYKVIRDDESIELWMPSYSETFVFVAEFIKAISDL